MKKYDIVIVGAGPVGCVVAERSARDMGWSSLVIERRPHIAGNCYDYIDENGLLLHRYGQHLFRTGSEKLLQYLSAFTEWIPGNYRIQALHKGQFYPLPINLTTLERFFGVSLTEEDARLLLEKEKIHTDNPKNSEEYVLSKVGRRLYEAFYLHYTQKQWGLHPAELLPSVCGRLPVRFNREDRYVDEPHQVMPHDGYTRLFENMLSHPQIDVLLNTDYFDVRRHIQPGVALVYTGPVDAYFDYRYGALPWRSLDFQWATFDTEYLQPCVAVNYSSLDYEYTRSVEIKHITGQRHPRTVISYEFSKSDGDPYYPVPTKANEAAYERYRQSAEREKTENNVHFCGRLATYSYLNMDQAIEKGLELYYVLKERNFKGKHSATLT